MRILHFDYDDNNNPYAGGGQSNATREIYSRLSKEHKITVVTGNYPDAKKINIKGINYKRIGIGGLGAKISLLSYWVSIPFYTLLHQHNYDLIVEFFTAPFSASFLPFVAKKPVIGCPTFFFAKELSKKYKLPFHLVESFCIKKYTYFIALSEYSKNKILSFNPHAKIEVISRGVTQEFLSADSKEGNYVLYLGRVDLYNKGLDTLLECWKKLIYEDKKDIKLVIAGNGKPQDEQTLKVLIDKYDLENYVELIGRVQGEKKIVLLANSLFIINPSRYETFGNVALESLAVGKPLICSDIEGYTWIPQDSALRFTHTSHEDLADKVVFLINDSSLRKSFSQKARDFAQHFSWDKISNQYANYFNKVALN